MEFITNFAQSFIALFQEAGLTLVGMVKGSVPMLIVLLTTINFIIKIIGEDKINNVARIFGKSKILTYGILQSFAWFFFSSPGALTVGRFLPEKCKPGYQDALGATAHPLTALFPHVVPSELFIWLGVAEGIKKIGLPVSGLAIRYIIAGIIVGLMRGFITEIIFVFLSKRRNIQAKTA